MNSPTLPKASSEQEGDRRQTARGGQTVLAELAPTATHAEDPHAAGVGGLGEACGHMRRPRGVARVLIFSSVRDLQLLFLGEFG